MSSEVTMIKGLCPTCGGQRNCTVHGHLLVAWEDDVHPVYGTYDHHLLQCNGCSTVFYHLNEHFSEHTTHDYINGEFKETPIDMITTYPAFDHIPTPSWVPKLESVDFQLFQIFNEMYSAYKSGHLILASIGLRTIFDRTTEILQIHPGLYLDEKIKQLKDEGFIGDTEANILSTVVDAGNAAAHRGWSPMKREFDELLNSIEQFVQRTVLSVKTTTHIVERIPPRVKRPKK
ncbi:TPA: DUF4145 domain-containing protein [Enterobacter hormaechei]|uniref:DUF4145 domain-containing protein n=1 Tax=Enterobacter TaxID=547 RepID=UPI00215BB22F|nr:DUF4145 domain-containing protein [Enterobacter sp. RIT 418]